MDRVRPIVGILLAVVAVGWFARAPVADRQAQTATDPPRTEPSDTAAAVDGQMSGGDGGGGAGDVGASVVQQLGRRNLDAVGDGVDLPQMGPDDLLRPALDGPAIVVRALAGSAEGSLHRVDAGGQLLWPVATVAHPRDIIWLGGDARTVVWADRGGGLWAVSDGQGPRPLPLPAGLRVLDATILPTGRVAVLTRARPGPDGRLAPHVMVIDLDQDHLVLDVVPEGASWGDRDRLPVHAWDARVERLLLALHATSTLLAVDLGSGTTTSRALPGSDAQEPLGGSARWQLDAAEGVVALSGVDRVRWPGRGRVMVPLGVTVYDRDLVPLAGRADGATVDVALADSADGSTLVLTEPIGGGLTIRDLDLTPRTAVLPSFQVDPLGTVDGMLYARASSGMSTDTLVAVDLVDGTLTGMLRIDRDAVFLPDTGLLLSPPD